MTVDDQAARARAEKVEALLAQLTAEEKVNLVSGLGFNLNFSQPEAFETVPGARCLIVYRHLLSP